jgi:hypothetical protein
MRQKTNSKSTQAKVKQFFLTITFIFDDCFARGSLQQRLFGYSAHGAVLKNTVALAAPRFSGM